MCCQLWHWLYNLFVSPIVAALSLCGSLLLPKLRKRRQLLKHQQSQLTIDKICLRTAQTIWFHAASMGELEQIKPLIRECRRRFPSVCIVVTIFSPSAYRQHYDMPADALLLLPYDGYRQMRTFIEALSPSLAVVSRYDLWWNAARILHSRAIPILVVNATFPTSAKIRLIKSYYRCLYNYVSTIVARSDRHAALFKQLGVRAETTVLPDTRIDQISIIMEHAVTRTFSFLDPTKFRLVLGSTWENDEICWQQAWQMLTPEDHQQLQLIIVPHEPTVHHVSHTMELFPTAITLSNLEHDEAQPSIVIVDRVGMLASLYYHASAAYVGGGFDRGVHSLLEPALAGIPIACGPNIKRSDDAYEMLCAGILTQIVAAKDVIQWIRRLLVDRTLDEMARTYRQTLIAQRGVSQQVVSIIERLLQPGFFSVG